MQSPTNLPDVRQRSDLTFKENKKLGRHGWLRLTPAYSVKLVRQILGRSTGAKRVLDPFSGTATTPICSAELGLEGYSVEINPFLVWLGNVKATHYSHHDLDRMDGIARTVAGVAAKQANSPVDPPPIRNIERWWNEPNLRYLCHLKAAVDSVEAGPIRDLLLVAFSRTMIALSNAAFNHQSMSFKTAKGKEAQIALIPHESQSSRQFLEDVQFVRDSAATPLSGKATVLHGDSRQLDVLDGIEKFDTVITSPPYPNRMSYIRELRPYMYWLGYLVEAKEAGELDWQAIGGTWGIATSRLSCWDSADDIQLPDYLQPILDKIRDAHPKNGVLMATYVQKYFEDMAVHLHALGRILEAGARLHYIIGNSSFYGHLVPAELLYADLMRDAGFDRCHWEIIRKRNSKKELYEFDVRGTWPG